MGLNNSSWRNRTRALIRRGAVALSIATTAIGAAASPALALEAGDIGSAKAYTAYNFSSEDDAVRLQTASEVLPAQYDLRDSGVVTPVKFQNPWGTCWGFSAIAASETSILSEKGQTYAETGLDLSERQLAYFAARHLPFGEEGDSYNNQAGEGAYNALTETDCLEDPEIAEDLLGYPLENAIFNQGGLPSYATSVFSDGIGPLPESMALYQNDEGYLGEDGTYWSPDGTWSLSEELRAKSTAALEESFVLPTPATFDEDGNYVYNELATAAMKEQIYQGRALSIAFCADQSMPGQLSENAYMNPDTWSRYTYEPASANRAVTIVGWDDSYPKESFNSEYQPPADGAWIVKNSWGAASNEFPNQRDWGDEGYFYMSYYDQSLVIVEAFDYDINGRETDKNDEFIASQYDYMTIDYSTCDAYDELASAANVFVAEDAQELTSLSCETSQPGTTVTYEVYRLADDAEKPTDGELVTTVEETYEYGGYHLVSIPEADRAKAQFAKGERFSVVVTQRGVSGDYLVLAQGGTNEAYHEWAIGVLTASENENHNVEAAIIEELRTRYRNENLDATDEEVDAYIASQADLIAKMVETYIQVALPLFGRSVVNPGESFLLGDGAWTDWSDVIASGTLPDAELIDYDNFSIKAYGDPFDLPFPDVAWGEWYFDAVTRASELGLMSGYDDGTFGPADGLTREQAAVVLWNALAEGDDGAPAADRSDVEQGEWYSTAVNWAVENGAMGGYGGSDEFGVGDGLTREQFCAVIANAAGAGLEGQDESALGAFADAPGISAWARPAVAWAVKRGVISGVEQADGSRTLDATRVLTRAEMAAMMVNAVDAVDAGVISFG